MSEKEGLYNEFIITEHHEEEKKRSSQVGLIFTGIIGSAAVLLTIVAAPFVSPALRKICLPYVPATDSQVNNVLKALKGRSGKLIDLGSGDGRIVVAAAQEMNFHATGVELNPWLVWYSKIYSWSKGQRQNTSFIVKDLWKVKLSPFNNVVIFGVEEMMADLQSKIIEELEDESCVIACRFPLPSWRPVATFGEGIDTVWLYEKRGSKF